MARGYFHPGAIQLAPDDDTVLSAAHSADLSVHEVYLPDERPRRVPGHTAQWHGARLPQAGDEVDKADMI